MAARARHGTTLGFCVTSALSAVYRRRDRGMPVKTLPQFSSLSCPISFPLLVRGSRGPKKANRNIVRQITKFGMIVYCTFLSTFEFNMHRKTLHKIFDFGTLSWHYWHSQLALVSVNILKTKANVAFHYVLIEDLTSYLYN